MGRAARLRVNRLAEKLLHVRRSLGLSQNELIKRMGLKDVIYQSSISGYESGEREPPLPILLQYARVAGVCLDWLVDDEQNLPAKLPVKLTHKTTPRGPVNRRKR
ncbi:MAG: helix-turn-helix domain-containing protein [Pyrinomonadaceae bacterium]